MPAALRAGMYPETTATSSSANAIPRYVGKSHGEVANNSDAITLATTNASSVPTAKPAPANRSVLPSTCRCTRPVLAPSAMRIPISGVCRVTE